MKDFIHLLIFSCLCLLTNGAVAPPVNCPTVSPSTAPTSTNFVSTVVGTGGASSTGTGGKATAATVNVPRSMILDSSGFIHFVEGNGQCIRKFSTSSMIVFAVAGVCGTTGLSGNGGQATSALLQAPVSLVLNTVGDMYFTDGDNNMVRKISTSSIITLYAGSKTGAAGSTGNGGQATAATFWIPHGLWLSSVNVIYITCYNNPQVRSVNLAGIVTLFAGSGASGSFAGDGGPATSAALSACERVMGDSTGLVYISDSGNYRVRGVTSGIITTFAGTGATTSNDDNQAPTSTNLNYPTGGAIDSVTGDIYISARQSFKIQVYTVSTGLMTTFAGSGESGSTGDGDGATSCTFNAPDGLFLDTLGKLYVADYQNYKIRAVYSVNPTAAPSGVPSLSWTPTVTPSITPSTVPSFLPSSIRSSVNTIDAVVGTGTASSSGTGGKATAAAIYQPRGIWKDSAGTLYWSEQLAHCIRKLSDTDNIVLQYAGVCGTLSYGGDGGQASAAYFNNPMSVFGNTVGSVYVADYANQRVRVVSSNLIVSLYAGTGTGATTGNGGQATAATLIYPYGLFLNTVSTLYVTSSGGYVVRAISVAGIITTYAGTGINSNTGDGGQATSAAMNTERVHGSSSGVVYISDSINSKIRRVSTAGIITTFVGNGLQTYSGENVAPTSTGLNSPSGIYYDTANGDTYVSNRGGCRIFVITATTGRVTTFAGSGVSGSTGNGGAATSAKLTAEEIPRDSTSAMYFNDYTYKVIRVIYSTAPTTSPTLLPTYSFAPTSTRSSINSVYLFAGTGASGSTGTGGLATSAAINVPRSVVQDTVGVVYFSEGSGNCVRQIGTDNIMSAYAGVCTTAGSYGGDGGPASSANINDPVGLYVSTTGVGYIAEYNSNRVRAVALVGATNMITTYAGTGSTTDSGNGGAATAGGINQCHGLWVNSVGVLYVTSLNSHQIRSVSASGILSLFVGTGSPSYSGDGGAATSATINGAEKLSGDTTGLVYVADSNNNRVRVVSTSGIITLVMGTGSTVWGSDGVAATSANVNFPDGLAKDEGNNDLYVSARDGNRILVLSGASNTVSSYAGSGTGGKTGDGGAATSARFFNQDGIYLNTNSELYVADRGNNKLRLVKYSAPTAAPSMSGAPSVLPSATPSMLPTVPLILNAYLFAGTGTGSSTGTGGKATSCTMNVPRSVVQDTTGLIYFTEKSGNCVRKIDSSNIVFAFAGVCGASASFAGDNAPATSANMNQAVGLSASSVGPVYMTDYGNNRVRVVSTAGIITTYAGTGSATNTGNGGLATAAGLTNAHALWVNSVGVLYVSLWNVHQVKKVDTEGYLTLYIGSSSGYGGDGGKATSAMINGPDKMSGDSTGAVYVADYNNKRVRLVTSSSIISTYLGVGTTATTWLGDGLPATSTSINGPDGSFTDSVTGDFYVSSSGFHRILKLSTSTNLVTTYAGTGTAGSSGDGGAATSASFNANDGLFLNTNGYMYVADQNNNKLRVVLYGAQVDSPTVAPTLSVKPTVSTTSPSLLPTMFPSIGPSLIPSMSPSLSPSLSPTCSPSLSPSVAPTCSPSLSPSVAPTCSPSLSPSVAPTCSPSLSPSRSPSLCPSASPSRSPSLSPSAVPSFSPTSLLQTAPTYKVANLDAFAGLTSAGAVMTWGATCCGGDSSSVSRLLSSGVTEVVQSKNAFAALKSDGSVVAWGLAREIEGSTAYKSYSTIRSLVATEQAFAGVTDSGGVIAFGADCCGGNVNQYGWYTDHLSSGVKSITASSGAFCALKSDGSVFCWGNKFAGGSVSSLTRTDLSDIVQLAATRSAFAGITSYGSVVVWGNSHNGGSLTSIKSASLAESTQYILGGTVAFVGYKTDNTLLAWGDESDGGDSSGVSGQFDYVSFTSSAFAAFKIDGAVVTWGYDSFGGDSSSVSSQLLNVSYVIGNAGAFAAINSSGRVVAWGDSSFGGTLAANVSSSIGSAVSAVYHTSRAFAVITSSEGGVVAWGHDNFGGEISSGVAESVSSGVRLICANENAFTAIKNDGTAYGWGHRRSNLGSGELSGDYSEVVNC